jgi:hypothetical protein
VPAPPTETIQSFIPGPSGSLIPEPTTSTGNPTNSITNSTNPTPGVKSQNENKENQNPSNGTDTQSAVGLGGMPGVLGYITVGSTVVACMLLCIGGVVLVRRKRKKNKNKVGAAGGFGEEKNDGKGIVMGGGVAGGKRDDGKDVERGQMMELGVTGLKAEPPSAGDTAAAAGMGISKVATATERVGAGQVMATDSYMYNNSDQLPQQQQQQQIPFLPGTVGFASPPQTSQYQDPTYGNPQFQQIQQIQPGPIPTSPIIYGTLASPVPAHILHYNNKTHQSDPDSLSFSSIPHHHPTVHLPTSTTANGQHQQVVIVDVMTGAEYRHQHLEYGAFSTYRPVATPSILSAALGPNGTLKDPLNPNNSDGALNSPTDPKNPKVAYQAIGNQNGSRAAGGGGARMLMLDEEGRRIVEDNESHHHVLHRDLPAQMPVRIFGIQGGMTIDSSVGLGGMMKREQQHHHYHPHPSYPHQQQYQHDGIQQNAGPVNDAGAAATDYMINNGKSGNGGDGGNQSRDGFSGAAGAINSGANTGVFSQNRNTAFVHGESTPIATVIGPKASLGNSNDDGINSNNSNVGKDPGGSGGSGDLAIVDHQQQQQEEQKIKRTDESWVSESSNAKPQTQEPTTSANERNSVAPIPSSVVFTSSISNNLTPANPGATNAANNNNTNSIPRTSAEAVAASVGVNTNVNLTQRLQQHQKLNRAQSHQIRPSSASFGASLSAIEVPSSESEILDSGSGVAVTLASLPAGMSGGGPSLISRSGYVTALGMSPSPVLEEGSIDVDFVGTTTSPIVEGGVGFGVQLEQGEKENQAQQFQSVSPRLAVELTSMQWKSSTETMMHISSNSVRSGSGGSSSGSAGSLGAGSVSVAVLAGANALNTPNAGTISPSNSSGLNDKRRASPRLQISIPGGSPKSSQGVMNMSDGNKSSTTELKQHQNSSAGTPPLTTAASTTAATITSLSSSTSSSSADIITTSQYATPETATIATKATATTANSSNNINIINNNNNNNSGRLAAVSRTNTPHTHTTIKSTTTASYSNPTFSSSLLSSSSSHNYANISGENASVNGVAGITEEEEHQIDVNNAGDGAGGEDGVEVSMDPSQVAAFQMMFPLYALDPKGQDD